MSIRRESDDSARFAAVYEQTRVAILGYLLRRVAQPGDAADLLAEVYLVAWRRIGDVPAGDEARLWLYAVARRTLANHRRRQARETDLAHRLRQQLSEQVSSDTDHPLADRLARCLDELSSDDRELIELSSWEELSAAQIGQVTGRTPGSVRVRLHRIRKRLAVRLAETEPAVS